jgi:hypothetical protein
MCQRTIDWIGFIVWAKLTSSIIPNADLHVSCFQSFPTIVAEMKSGFCVCSFCSGTSFGKNKISSDAVTQKLNLCTNFTQFSSSFWGCCLKLFRGWYYWATRCMIGHLAWLSSVTLVRLIEYSELTNDSLSPCMYAEWFWLLDLPKHRIAERQMRTTGLSSCVLYSRMVAVIRQILYRNSSRVCHLTANGGDGTGLQICLSVLWAQMRQDAQARKPNTIAYVSLCLGYESRHPCIDMIFSINKNRYWYWPHARCWCRSAWSDLVIAPRPGLRQPDPVQGHYSQPGQIWRKPTR